MLKLKSIFLFLVTIGSGANFAGGQSAETLETLLVDGVERQWRAFVPSSYQKDRPTSVVLNFHSTGSAPFRQAQLSEFELLGEEEGFLVISPAAANRRSKDGKLIWNVDQQEAGVDDVQFIRELITHISKRYTIDSARVFATGMSGGARMSSRLACELSDQIAAIGPVAGIRYPEDCHPNRPVPVITFHGKEDNINHYELRADSRPHWRMGVEEAIAGWVRNNQCPDSPVEGAVSESVTRVFYPGCQGDVVFYRSADAGHTWPGSSMAGFYGEIGFGKTNSEIPATRLIWEFFSRHPLR